MMQGGRDFRHVDLSPSLSTCVISSVSFFVKRIYLSVLGSGVFRQIDLSALLSNGFQDNHLFFLLDS